MLATTMKRLVNVESGLIDRRIYTDPDIYQQELEQVFGRCWVGVGHISQIPNPNDFCAAYIAEDPILVTRDSKGKIHAFLNMCRHRGNRICRADAGNAPSFMCTYHGWTFATDGKLVGVPGYKEAYFEELDRSQWGLVEVGNIDSYKGLLFATWDKSAPSLLDYLGDAAWYLDVILDRRAGGTELLPGVQKQVMASNWKIPCDNVGGDGYHFPITHGSAVAVNQSLRERRGMLGVSNMNSDKNNVCVYAGNGHAFLGRYNGPPREVAEGVGPGLSPVVAEYFKQHTDEFKRRMGDARSYQQIGTCNIFPYTTMNAGVILRLRIPRGPLKTEAWTYCLVDKDAPQEVKDAQRPAASYRMGATGIVQMDDSNNWDMVSRSGTFWRAKSEPASFEMGIGKDGGKSEIIPGMIAAGISEANQRAFYGFWAEVMDAPSWSRVKLSPRTYK